MTDGIHRLAVFGRELTLDPGHMYGDSPDDFCPSGVISVLLNLTHGCNLACKYCIMGMPELKPGYQDLAVSMDSALVRDAVDYARSVSLPDTSLTFFGGEPLLRFDLLKEAVRYAEESYPGWFSFNVITNGTLLTPEMGDFCGRRKIRFLFSLDGGRMANDRLRVYKKGDASVFEDAWKNIARLLKQYPDIEYKVNVTYFRPTLDLADAFRTFLALGVPETRFERGLAPSGSPYAVTMNDIDAVRDAFSSIAREYRAHLINGGAHVVDNFVVLMRKIARQTPRLRGCNMGLDYLTVAADGSIYPCHKLVGHPGYRLGHVRDGASRDPCRPVWETHVLRRQPCNVCWARFLCGGFCISDNLHASGDFFTPVPENCAIIQHNIGLALWLYHELEDHGPRALKRLLGDDYLAPDDIPVLRPEAICRETPSRVRQFESGAVYELNDTAVYIFDQCDGRTGVEEIARRLALSAGIPEKEALSDTRRQVGLFRQAGICRIATGS